MQKNLSQHIRLFILLITLSVISSCKTQQGVLTKNNADITANINLTQVINDKLKVEIKTSGITTETINYFIPKIVPGTYQNDNYGKFLDEFKAFDSNNNELATQRINDNQWQISNAQKLHKITYWANDTYDSEQTHQVFSPTGTNISKDNNFILNLHAFIGYFEGMKENRYKLFINHPSILKASTSIEEQMENNTNPNAINNMDYFIFNRYADVVDNPIMYAEPDQVTFNIDDLEVLLSVYSKNKKHTALDLKQEMLRMMKAQKSFLGDSISIPKKYSILLYLSTSKSDDANGYGALEHNTSTVVVLPESISKERLIKALTDVVSHEFFHIVTPLTIHSKEIHDFDYNNPKMSKHLWLYEGTTEYFSKLFQVRQSLDTREEFFETIRDKIETASLFDSSYSFTEFSKNILKKEYHKDYRNVYEKGTLISLCLDIIIREKSEGDIGILDLIKELSKRYGTEKPFNDETLFDKMLEITYPEVVAFLKEHVADTKPIDYEFYLNKVGLRYRTSDLPSSYFLYNQQPFVKGSDTSKEVIFTSDIPFNSFLKELGIMKGDALVSINNKPYKVDNIYDLFGDSKKWKLGEDITFKIKRKDEFKILKSTVSKPTVKKISIEQNPDASEYEIRLQKKWLND